MDLRKLSGPISTNPLIDKIDSLKISEDTIYCAGGYEYVAMGIHSKNVCNKYVAGDYITDVEIWKEKSKPIIFLSTLDKKLISI